MALDLLSFPEMLDVPDWITDNSAWIYHLPLAPLLIKLLRPRVFVELGTFKGDSYMAFCQAVHGQGVGTKCFAVDTWEGDDHAGRYGPGILQDLKRVHDPKFSPFSTLMQMRFDQAVGAFADDSIDLLHIDGLHTYEAVKQDFEQWLPKMTERGVVIFHDTTIKERGFGVWQLWAELAEKYPTFEVPHGCGLGMAAVGSAVPPEFLTFLAKANLHKAAVVKYLNTLGHRLELMRTCMMLVNDAHSVQSMVNEWKKSTGRPVTNGQNKAEAWAEPVAFSRKMMRETGTVIVENVQLLKEVTELRKKVAKLEPSPFVSVM